MSDKTPTPSTDAPPAARWFDLRRLPPGVVPRNLQQWVLIGIAVVMVGILALSGPAPKPRTTTTTPAAAVAVDPNQKRIEDYQRAIQEQAQRLAAEQAKLQLAKDSLDAQSPTSMSAPTAVGPYRIEADADDKLPSTAPRPTVDRDDRAEHARFADNVAFSRASNSPASPSKTGAAAAPTVSESGTPGLPSLPAFPGPPAYPALPVFPAPPAPVSTPPAASDATPTPASSRQMTPVPPSSATPFTTAHPALPALSGVEGPANPALPALRLFGGTIIETVLTNRLDATFNGPVNCLVSVPVYANDRLVIPSGARVLGEARAVNTFGQTRVAVAFHRLILPNGQSLSLDNFQGLNQAGDVGLRDQVNRHYAQIFGVSLALGAIAGFAQAQTSVGVNATAEDTYRQGISANVSQSSARILDRFLNILPTVTIREGHRIKVYLSQDLELPEYQPAHSR